MGYMCWVTAELSHGRKSDYVDMTMRVGRLIRSVKLFGSDETLCTGKCGNVMCKYFMWPLNLARCCY